MKRRTIVSVLVVGAFAVTAPALAHDSGGPEHGEGGTSSACWDQQTPGQGFESGSLGRLPFVSVGTQAGSHTEVGHYYYADTCMRVETPTVLNTSARYGFYFSQRGHIDPAQCPTLQQYILREDPDSSVQVLPYVNTCP